ncbi:MAG: branched-chain amino acid ABC transporter permease [Bdellovibrionales bacterium]|nr:branched-chain amino acid ABC transporter permease [Bdellovibrionales bacterium]
MGFSLLNGLVLGSIYAVSAMGLSLIAGLMRLVQFSHGEFFVLASYCFAFLLRSGIGLIPSLLLSLLVSFIAGVLTERLLLSRAESDHNRSMMMTFILSIVLSNAFLIFFGPYPVQSEARIDGSIEIFPGISMGSQRMVSGAIAMISFLMFYLWVRFTRMGRAIRAVAQDPEVALSFGINPVRTRTLAFGISTALAGLAGVVLSPIFPVVPDSGAQVTLTAISVMVIGGMGSIRGAAVAGLLLGLAESLGSHYLSTRYAPAFGFLFLILTLLFRPRGLYGNRV